MDSTSTLGQSRLRDIRGNVPIHVVVWLEQHPTALLACALSLAAPNVRWHFRIGSTLQVVLRNGRVEVIDSATEASVGSARISGVRAAADFDTLPKAPDPPPFNLPEPLYP